MTREEFIKVLDKKGYSYKIEGDRIVVTDKRNALLGDLTSLPPGVEFKNKGDVYLGSLIGGEFDDWEGNIEGIEGKRLLNLMVKQGVFER